MTDPILVRWTESASKDLRGIARYIRKDNPAAARAVASAIFDAAESLGAFPLNGREGGIAGSRELVISRLPYIVVYRVTRTAIQILHIYHGARNRPGGL
jgi:addiction module RelE/StbE family toxin